MATTVWKGHLTFGLVSFPVKLFTAARADGISFNQLHKTDNSRIKQVIYCQAEDKPIPRSEIVKGYEYEKDHYVVVEDEEIKKMAPPTAKIMEELGLTVTNESIAAHYRGLVDALVIDTADAADRDRIDMPVLVTRTMMRDLIDRERLANEIVVFAASLTRAQAARRAGDGR